MSLEETSAPPEPPPPEPPPPRSSISAQRLAAQLLDEQDRVYLEALRDAGLLAELDAEELLRVASEVEETDAERRRVDLLELYFDAAGDEEAARRRRSADRFFVQRVGDPATAAGLVERLAALTPELEGVVLERIGGGDGPLVVRSGESFSAVLDDYEEETDTDQIDLRELERRREDVPMVTVRGLVRALNVLLDKQGVRERLVSLRGDADREVYVKLGVAEAVQLARSGYLEDVEAEDVMELGGW
ncbi:MAG TPA: hypothetical protein RMH99_24495 [Sandaracinaceae bacterium LLY-WYZ-13_1]|nr:hypothetical protein [Sandaracinaceae bacterium LLY-WYZ-13_1]